MLQYECCVKVLQDIYPKYKSCYGCNPFIQWDWILDGCLIRKIHVSLRFPWPGRQTSEKSRGTSHPAAVRNSLASRAVYVSVRPGSRVRNKTWRPGFSAPLLLHFFSLSFSLSFLSSSFFSPRPFSPTAFRFVSLPSVLICTFHPLRRSLGRFFLRDTLRGDAMPESGTGINLYAVRVCTLLFLAVPRNLQETSPGHPGGSTAYCFAIARRSNSFFAGHREPKIDRRIADPLLRGLKKEFLHCHFCGYVALIVPTWQRICK